MIAVRISPDERMTVVGAPAYFESRQEPKTPQQLVDHVCINLRLPTHGGLYAWEFEKAGREVRVRVDGQLFFNGTNQMLNAALASPARTELIFRVFRLNELSSLCKRIEISSLCV